MHNTSRRQNVSYWAKVLIVGALLGFGIQFLQAWTAPPASPPNGNVAGPLTVSGVAQTKTGNLILGNDLGVSRNVAVGNTLSAPTICLAGDCRAAWPTPSASGVTSITGGTGINITNASGPAVTVSADINQIIAQIFSNYTDHTCNMTTGSYTTCAIPGVKNFCTFTNVYGEDSDDIDGFACRIDGTPGQANWSIRNTGKDYRQVYCAVRCF